MTAPSFTVRHSGDSTRGSRHTVPLVVLTLIASCAYIAERESNLALALDLAEQSRQMEAIRARLDMHGTALEWRGRGFVIAGERSARLLATYDRLLGYGQTIELMRGIHGNTPPTLAAGRMLRTAHRLASRSCQ